MEPRTASTHQSWYPFEFLLLAGKFFFFLEYVVLYSVLRPFQIKLISIFLFGFSLSWTASGGHGSTTSVSRTWSRLSGPAGASRPSQPWTTWPEPPAGLCSERGSKASIPPTRGSRDATKPKTSPDAENSRKTELKLSRPGFLFGGFMVSFILVASTDF